MKHTLLVLAFISCFSFVYARHITGGEMTYEFIGAGANNSSKYRITLMLFRDDNCANCAQMPVDVSIGFFNNDNNVLISVTTVPLSSTQLVPINALPLCITSAPSLRYFVGFYIFNVDLPANNSGYTGAYQTCCRIDNIENIPDGIGATYTCKIPGTNNRPAGFTDKSPRFARGISVVCYKKPFTLDFSATDSNGDSLVYSLCDAYNGGAATSAANITPSAPPYGSVGYTGGYSGFRPLGGQASINSQTGIISGIAPDAGKYVVSVCVSSYRNGAYISEHRKDFIITVAPCDFAGAQLLPSYLSCDGFTFNFENLNNSPLNLTYYWDFGDGDTSSSPAPMHTYLVAGVYTLKLVINRGQSCSDSASSPLKVFPGYFPGFNENSPICKDKPLQFTDATTANYGTPNSWYWDFGDTQTAADTSRLKNPVYTYHLPGTYNATLIVASDKGCVDTVTKAITIVDKPVFSVTNDTLICSIDTLQLNAVAGSAGVISWSPNYNISSLNSFTPLVSPDLTTTYHVSFVDNSGCSTTDSVKVNVVDFVTLSIGGDTTICRTDAITLIPNSDGLHYVWTPAATLNDPNIKNPVATPIDPATTYHVRANIGKCFADDEITISTVPYPDADAGADTLICFGRSAQLHASGGSIYSWSPSAFLTATNIPNPVSVNPVATVIYVVTVRDVLGCPKPVMDTIIVNVAKIIANAGPRDTSIVIEQPLQLFATGSTSYSWSPVTWLSDPNIANPISLPQDNIEYVVKVSNSIGCFSTDTINVHLFKVKPDLYVPTAFTPNGDGLNDFLRPKALGLKSVDAFMVYNRWGQMLFSTTDIGTGWDGTFGGAPQSPGTYVWYAQGTDYKNNKLERKGTAVLIR
ncbi:MAG: PKD domain-containing protein [Ferruginibacter sp.]